MASGTYTGYSSYLGYKWGIQIRWSSTQNGQNSSSVNVQVWLVLDGHSYATGSPHSGSVLWNNSTRTFTLTSHSGTADVCLYNVTETIGHDTLGNCNVWMSASLEMGGSYGTPAASGLAALTLTKTAPGYPEWGPGVSSYIADPGQSLHVSWGGGGGMGLSGSYAASFKYSEFQSYQDGAWGHSWTGASFEYYYTMPSVTRGVSINMRVRICNNYDVLGGWAYIPQYVVCNVLPTAPTWVAASPTMLEPNANLTFSWGGDTGGSYGGGSYHVQYSVNSGGSWVDWSTSYGSTSISSTGFSTRGGNVRVRVYRINAGGYTTDWAYSNVAYVNALPTISCSNSNYNWTNQSVTITITGACATTGIASINTPGGNVGGASTTYTVTANGTYTFTVNDNVGNRASQSVVISNIDKTVPSIGLSANHTTAITATNSTTGVVCNIAPSDSNSGVNTGSYYYKVDSGGYIWFSGNAFTPTLTNGSHTITVSISDYAGNSASQSVAVYVDLVAPSIGLSANHTTAITATNSTTGVVCNIAPSDSNSGLKTSSYYYNVDGGGSVGFAGNAFTPTLTEGSHTITVGINDNAGNYASQSVTVYVDLTSPNIGLTADGHTTQITATNSTTGVVCNIAPTDPTSGGIASGVITSNYYYKIDTGNWIIFTGNTFTPTLTDGTHTITVRVYDYAGNVKDQSITVYVDLVTPVLSYSYNSVWTNQSIVITITSTDSRSGVKNITTPGGTISGASTTYTASANGNYNFSSADNAGNVVNGSVTITNIDKTIPTFTLEEITDGTHGSTAWTNNYPSIGLVSPADAGGSGLSLAKWASGRESSNTVAYFASNGNTFKDWVGATGALSFQVTANNYYTVFVKDVAGNGYVDEFNVTNIDRAVPSASYSLNPSTPTAGNITITVTPSDTGGSGVKNVTDPASVVHTTYPFNYVVTTANGNGTYNFTVLDNAGNSYILSVPVTNYLPLPVAPTVFTLTGLDSSKMVLGGLISVNWSGASGTINSFEVDYCTTYNGVWGSWSTNYHYGISNGSIGFSDTWANNSGVLIKYRIRARNAAGVSGWVESNSLKMVGLIKVYHGSSFIIEGVTSVYLGGAWTRVERVFIYNSGSWKDSA